MEEHDKDNAQDAEVVPNPTGKEVVKKEDALPEPAKKEFSIQVAELRCDRCFLSESCAYYKAGAECSLGIHADVENAKDVSEFSKKMLTIAAERVLRAYHFEKTNGGVISPEVSDAMRQFMDLTRWVKELGDNRDEVTIKAKGSGIISQLFGNMGQK